MHIAEASEGVYSFYTTGGNLNATVINVLMKASAASIYNLRFRVDPNATFQTPRNDSYWALERNDLFNAFAIIGADDFNRLQLNCTFKDTTKAPKNVFNF